MSDKITCPKCGGEGVIALPARWLETLDVVRKHGPMTTDAVMQHLRFRKGDLNIGVTAINNRLSALKELGFVTTKNTGSRHNPYEWTAIKAETNAL